LLMVAGGIMLLFLEHFAKYVFGRDKSPSIQRIEIDLPQKHIWQRAKQTGA